jgi:hypothetical protein
MEQLHNLAALLDVFTVLYPQLQDIDFRTDAVELEVPVYLVQGRYEAPGRARPAEEWFGLIDAPKKQLIILDTSGHRPSFEQPERFHRVMIETCSQGLDRTPDASPVGRPAIEPSPSGWAIRPKGRRRVRTLRWT